MARYIVIFACLAAFAALASCSKTAKYCKHVSCTVVDKDCTKPLKARAFCSCYMKKGKLKKAYGTCPDKTVFNGENDKCEPDSKASRAFCRRQ